MNTQKLAPTQAVPADIALIVFGKGPDNKFRASRFGSIDAAHARRGAKLLGMKYLSVVSDDQHAIAAKLPRGKIAANQLTVVPLVKQSLYRKVSAMAETPTESISSQNSIPPSGSNTSDNGGQWDFKVGDLVLAVENDVDGWHECNVERVDGDVLTLSWEGWPDEPHFFRKVTQLAICHPNRTAPY